MKEWMKGSKETGYYAAWENRGIGYAKWRSIIHQI